MDMLFINTVLIPGAVGVIMFGIGLGLTVTDFARVLRFPRAVVTGLLVQTVVLVAVAYAITRLFALPPSLAIGLMVLAASPGGALANLFSHLARGDVALNVTLTAVNSLLALAWVPLVLDWTLQHFVGEGQPVLLPTQKLMEVAMVIVGPILLGMTVQRLAPVWATRFERRLRFLSVALLITVIAVTIHSAGRTLLDHFAAVGLACLAFNVVSIAIGYVVPRAVGLSARQAVSIAFERGVHTAAIAIYIAAAVLKDPIAGIPPALYGLIQIMTASLLVLWLRHRPVHVPTPSTTT